jgi:hypothetical protein
LNVKADDLPAATKAFLGRYCQEVFSEDVQAMRADLAALLETVRATERERAAAHIDVDFSRTGREFAAAIRGME